MTTKASDPWFSEYIGQWVVDVIHAWAPGEPVGVVHETHTFGTEVEAQAHAAKINGEVQ